MIVDRDTCDEMSFRNVFLLLFKGTKGKVTFCLLNVSLDGVKCGYSLSSCRISRQYLRVSVLKDIVKYSV